MKNIFIVLSVLIPIFFGETVFSADKKVSFDLVPTQVGAACTSLVVGKSQQAGALVVGSSQDSLPPFQRRSRKKELREMIAMSPTQNMKTLRDSVAKYEDIRTLLEKKLSISLERKSKIVLKQVKDKIDQQIQNGADFIRGHISRSAKTHFDEFLRDRQLVLLKAKGLIPFEIYASIPKETISGNYKSVEGMKQTQLREIVFYHPLMDSPEYLAALEYLKLNKNGNFSEPYSKEQLDVYAEIQRSMFPVPEIQTTLASDREKNANASRPDVSHDMIINDSHIFWKQSQRFQVIPLEEGAEWLPKEFSMIARRTTHLQVPSREINLVTRRYSLGLTGDLTSYEVDLPYILFFETFESKFDDEITSSPLHTLPGGEEFLAENLGKITDIENQYNLTFDDNFLVTAEIVDGEIIYLARMSGEMGEEEFFFFAPESSSAKTFEGKNYGPLVFLDLVSLMPRGIAPKGIDLQDGRMIHLAEGHSGSNFIEITKSNEIESFESFKTNLLTLLSKGGYKTWDPNSSDNKGIVYNQYKEPINAMIQNILNADPANPSSDEVVSEELNKLFLKLSEMNTIVSAVSGLNIIEADREVKKLLNELRDTPEILQQDGVLELIENLSRFLKYKLSIYRQSLKMIGDISNLLKSSADAVEEKLGQIYQKNPGYSKALIDSYKNTTKETTDIMVPHVSGRILKSRGETEAIIEVVERIKIVLSTSPENLPEHKLRNLINRLDFLEGKKILDSERDKK